MPTLEEVVDAYVVCGNTIGFFYAEFILMKHLPEDKPDGKCYDVPKNNRADLLSDLRNATAHGVQMTDQGLQILDGGKQRDDDDLFCSEHQCAKNLVDYPDGSRYECPECECERGEALGLA